MGGFYGSIHVKTTDRASVQRAVEAIAKKQKNRFLLAPALNGWVSVYPETHGQDERVAKALARQIAGDVVYLLVHDDDVFAYSYFNDGKLIDEFNSRPDYFAKTPAKTKAKLRGKPLLLQQLLAPGKSVEDLISLLASETVERTVFASELMQRFADLLGLPNAVNAYEYLMEGETEGTEAWEEFIHIPDLSEQKRRKRAAEAEIEEEKERLRREAFLVYERQGDKKKMGTSVTWCPDRTGKAFLVYWQNILESDPVARPLERIGPPWTSGLSITEIVCGPFVFQLRLSPSGRLLAVSYASGNWKTALWDLAAQELRWEIQNEPHTAPRLLFSPDENYLIGHAYEGIVSYSTVTGECVSKSTNCVATHAGMHPTGLLVIGDPSGKLILYDSLRAQRIKTVCMGQKQDHRAMRAVFGRIADQFTDQAALEQTRLHLEKQLPDMIEMLRRWSGRGEAEIQATLRPQGYVFNPDGSLNVAQTAAGMIEQMRSNAKGQQQRMQEAFDRPGVESSGITGTEHPASLLCSPDGRWLFCGTDHGLLVYDWNELMAAEEATPRPMYQVKVPPVMVEQGSHMIPHDARTHALTFDSVNNRLLFAGQDGVIRCLDLPSGLHRTVLALPGKPSMWEMGLCSDRKFLCCIVHPPLAEQKHHTGTPTLQIWNYARLCEQLEARSNLRLLGGDE